jgi:hypothetical protein
MTRSNSVVFNRALAGLFVLAACLVPTAASAHGGLPEGPRQIYTQTVGRYELAVIIEAPPAVPAPLFVDIVPKQPLDPSMISLRLAPRGAAFEEAPATGVEALPGEQSVFTSRLEVDRAGPWELEVSIVAPEGTSTALIPFMVRVAPLPPFTVPLLLSLGSLFLLMLAGVVVAAMNQGRPQRSRVWLDRLLGYAIFASAIASIIFGIQQVIASTEALPSYAAPVGSGRPHANMDLQTEPGAPTAGQPLMLTLDMSDGGTGQPVDDLVSHHEALVHLVVLDETGAFMTHQHPPRVAPGRFTITITPDRPGTYTAYAEIQRQDSGTQVVARSFRVSGPAAPPQVPAPGLGERTIDDVQIEVASSLTPLRAGKQATLTFALSHHQAPLADIQPYLGMAGHLFARSEDGMTFAHVHAAEPVAPSDPRAVQPRYGPTVRFAYTFPKPGTYQLWAQFQRDNQILTVPLTLEVAP